MPYRTLFTPDEWQLLLDVPPLVGSAVMVAGRSGLGTVKEAFVLANAVLSGKQEYGDNPLVVALVNARLEEGERSDVEKWSGPYHALDAEQLRKTTAEKCHAVRELLAAKCPAESGGYSEWAVHVGRRVAEAAKEGGFLGIGGERVSIEEKEVLDEIATALGVQ